MKYILIFVIMGLFASCVQEVPIDHPQSESKVVITGMPDPWNPITFKVVKLMPFTDTTAPQCPKILGITITEDNVPVADPNGTGPDFRTSIYPKSGSKYQLTVITETDTLIAGTTIPDKIYLTKADYRFSPVPSQKFDKPVEAYISWDDQPGKKNYYELQILDAYLKALSYFQFDPIDDPVVQQESDLDYAPTSFLFSDKQFDGKTYNLTLRFGIASTPSKPGHAYVVLRNISEEYYHFKKSWHKHIFLQNTNIGWDGGLNFTNIYSLLFQGDPISLYTNVRGGLGIFAGYSQDIRKFKFVE